MKTSLLALILSAVFSLSACDTNDGPIEEAGEEIDQGVDDLKDTADDAADELDDEL